MIFDVLSEMCSSKAKKRLETSFSYNIRSKESHLALRFNLNILRKTNEGDILINFNAMHFFTLFTLNLTRSV